MKTSRTIYYLYNSISASLGQIINLLFSFAARTVFIKILGEQYLGLNGLFTNILNILSFTELGIGAAITYSLYEPLAKKNEYKVLAIMQLYKKIYRYIALIILTLGLVFTPFLPYVINGNTDNVGNIYIAFILFLLNSVVSFLFNYKRSIFFADQRGYINSINTTIFQIAAQSVQIIFLFLVSNYYLYLIIQIIFTFLSNIQISHVANKKYEFLKSKKKAKIDDSVIKYIKKNVLGMMSSKIGGIVVNSTDNLILSTFGGLSIVGIYSNYTLILNGLTSVFNQGVGAITSSIGNLKVNSDKSKQNDIFYKYSYINGLLSLITSIGLISFFTPFIKLWVGSNFILDNFTSLLIVLNFFITQLRQSNINFTNAYGLYWEQRFKPIFEILVNLFISLFLVTELDLGIKGVVIGTICSNIFVNSWWEPFIIIKKGINASLVKYFKFYISQFIIGIICILLSQKISVHFNLNNIFFSFGLTIILIVISIIIYIIIMQILFIKKFKFNIK